MLLPAKRAFPCLLLAALVGLATVTSGCASPALAAPGGAAPDRSITVLGRGTISAKPDMAQASMGVETLAPTVGEAIQQNKDRMAAVMARLQELGIADKDIQTANFSINFERQGSDPANGQYRVSNMVQIKIRDLDKVSSLIDSAIRAGANQVWGVNFTIDDQSDLQAQARTKAVEDARQRADALAKLANVQLGAVLTVSEGGAVQPIPMRYGMGGGGAMAEAAQTTPINPGEVQVLYQLEVTYALQ